MKRTTATMETLLFFVLLSFLASASATELFTPPATCVCDPLCEAVLDDVEQGRLVLLPDIFIYTFKLFTPSAIQCCPLIRSTNVNMWLVPKFNHHYEVTTTGCPT